MSEVAYCWIRQRKIREEGRDMIREHCLTFTDSPIPPVPAFLDDHNIMVRTTTKRPCGIDGRVAALYVNVAKEDNEEKSNA